MSNRYWFDDLAKTLAGARSRREALRGLGAAFAVALVPRAVLASPECVDACKSYGLKGRALGACIAECATTGQVPLPPGYTQCGPSVCGPGEFCCNESCGICAPIGGTCIQIFCG